MYTKNVESFIINHQLNGEYEYLRSGFLTLFQNQNFDIAQPDFALPED